MADNRLIIEWDRKLESTPNAGRPWSPGAKYVATARAKEQRSFARNEIAGLYERSKRVPPLPATVRLIRVAPGELDYDNLVAAFKHYRDGIADAFKTNDGPRSRLKFEYGQKRSKRERKPKASKYAIRVEVIS